MSNVNKIAEHAHKVIERVRGENDNLNAVIAAMVGALQSKTKEDKLDISAEEIFVDRDPNTMDERKLVTIEYDDDGALCYTENENEEDLVDLDSLPLNTRLELAEKLADLLES